MYSISCGAKNPEDAKFCAKCGNQTARASEAAATPAQHPFDPQSAGLDAAVYAYQLSVFIEMAKGTYGLAISEKIRTQVLLLSSFDAKLESQLPTLFEAFRAGIAMHDPDSPQWHPIDDPQTKFHMTLATSITYTSDWPEERKPELLMPLAERLDTGRLWAEEVFGPELKVPVHIADTFRWAETPGPFERQLQRQHNNPLFPATVRAVSAHQVTDARIADLKQISDFMQCYKPFVRRALSLSTCTTKEALDFLKEGIDLSQERSVLGDYFLSEQKVLKAGSDAMQREIIEMTNEPSLPDSLGRYRALSDVGALLEKVRTGFPPGCDAEDYTVRAVLSEDLQTIVDYAAICRYSGETLAKGSRESAERIVAEAIRDGMPSNIANTKLGAFLSGLNEGRSQKPSGIWSGLKRIIGR